MDPGGPGKVSESKGIVPRPRVGFVRAAPYAPPNRPAAASPGRSHHRHLRREVFDSEHRSCGTRRSQREKREAGHLPAFRPHRSAPARGALLPAAPGSSLKPHMPVSTGVSNAFHDHHVAGSDRPGRSIRGGSDERARMGLRWLCAWRTDCTSEDDAARHRNAFGGSEAITTTKSPKLASRNPKPTPSLKPRPRTSPRTRTKTRTEPRQRKTIGPTDRP